MVRRRLTTGLIALLLILAAVPCFAWKFVSMADSRGTDNGVNTATLNDIISLVNAENVDLVIFQGDSVTGSTSNTTLSSHFDNWLSVMANLNCAWYLTVGNHEIQGTTQEALLRGKVAQPLNGPTGYEEFVFSIDYENAHFVFLNSNHEGEDHHVQRPWLSTDMAGTDKPHIFVMAHEPAYPKGPHVGGSLDAYPSEVTDLWNIMTNAGVKMFFCGHEHLFARSTHGSIYQIINGTCGAPISDEVPGTIGEYHYVLVEVNGYDVSCTAKNVSGQVIDTWSYTVPQATPNTIPYVKSRPNGTQVRLVGKTVTVGTDQFSSAAYVEDEDRSSGIKVYGTGISATTNSGITVTGTISSLGGERCITSPVITPVTRQYAIPPPLGMVTRVVGGGALNDNTPGVTGGISTHNTGLLIRVWGRVTFTDTANKAFYVDDGSGLTDPTGHAGIQIQCGGRPTGNNLTLPSGGWVKVTGISARRTSGTTIVPIVRPRTQADIVPY